MQMYLCNVCNKCVCVEAVTAAEVELLSVSVQVIINMT